MKKILALFLAFFMTIAAAGCGIQDETLSQQMPPDSLKGKKVLVAYFSWEGHTKKIAEEIHEKIPGSDIFEITPLVPYSTNYVSTLISAYQEKSDGRGPEMKDYASNMGSYDVVFLGYPIWWYEEPMIIRTFMRVYPLQGKIIIPFSTSSSTSIDASVSDIRHYEPGAKVLDGKNFRNDKEKAAMDEWLKDCGF